MCSLTFSTWSFDSLSSFSSCLILLSRCFTSWMKVSLALRILSLWRSCVSLYFLGRQRDKHRAVKCFRLLGQEQGRRPPVFIQDLRSLNWEPRPSPAPQLLFGSAAKGGMSTWTFLINLGLGAGGGYCRGYSVKRQPNGKRLREKDPKHSQNRPRLYSSWCSALSALYTRVIKSPKLEGTGKGEDVYLGGDVGG